VLTFAVRRVAQLVPVLLLISFIVFMLIHIVPGGPIAVLMGEGHSDPVVEAMMRTRLGLDQPLMVQYFRWLGLVLQGDLGTSIYTHEPILRMILDRFSCNAVARALECCRRDCDQRAGRRHLSGST
jgi:peptide/nickel transport system permease protein